MRVLAILSLLLLGAWADNLPATVPRLKPSELKMQDASNLLIFHGKDYFFRGRKAFADQSGGEMLKGELVSAADGIYTGRRAAFECVIVFDQTLMTKIATFGTLPDGYSAVACESVNQLQDWQVILPTRTLDDIHRFEADQHVDELGLHKSLLLLTETDRAGIVMPVMVFRVVVWAPLGRPLNWDAQYRDATLFGKLAIAMAKARLGIE